MLRKVHRGQVSQVINTQLGIILTCTDAKRDVGEDSIMTEPNEGGMSIERRNVGKRPTTTGEGIYKLAHRNYFLITSFLFIKYVR